MARFQFDFEEDPQFLELELQEQTKFREGLFRSFQQNPDFQELDEREQNLFRGFVLRRGKDVPFAAKAGEAFMRGPEIALQEGLKRAVALAKGISVEDLPPELQTTTALRDALVESIGETATDILLASISPAFLLTGALAARGGAALAAPVGRALAPVGRAISTVAAPVVSPLVKGLRTVGGGRWLKPFVL